MKRLIRQWLGDERGATAIEYGLICALLSVVVVTAITGLGNQLYSILQSATNAITH